MQKMLQKFAEIDDLEHLKSQNFLCYLRVRFFFTLLPPHYLVWWLWNGIVNNILDLSDPDIKIILRKKEL